MSKHLTKTPPATLIGKVAKARWTRTITTLADEGRKLPASNEGTLEGYCAAFQLLADCEESIQTEGLLVDGGRDGQRRSPALSGKVQALSAIKGFAVQLGLSPASSGRIQPEKEEEENPFAKL